MMMILESSLLYALQIQIIIHCYRLSSQADGVINSAVIVALYGGDPQMTSKLEEAVKVVQNTPICIKYALTGEIKGIV